MAPPAGLEPATPDFGIQRTFWDSLLFSVYLPLFYGLLKNLAVIKKKLEII